ncbi:hypothetical protein GQ55_6G068000 [Panicum hallii var. hallii]|uniref:Uncharacterized protein n=1 Tax=Panicum hallii var. hallii TaxID=1504633 RepID=A0A2T7D4Q4_9POAL|nr:hypothetical protein GQ55_6G068000 [Panicum hallii var. hallii]
MRRRRRTRYRSTPTAAAHARAWGHPPPPNLAVRWGQAELSRERRPRIPLSRLGLRAPGSRHARPRALSRPRAVPCAHASPVASITLFRRPRPSTSLAALPTRSRCLESRPRPAPTRPATRTRRRHRRRRLLHARHEGYSFRSVPVRVPELAGRCRPGRGDGRSAARHDPEHS